MIKLSEIIEAPISGEWGNDDASGTGVPVIRTANFTNTGQIDFTDVVTRDIPQLDRKVHKFLKHGDIIIEKSGGSPAQPVGRVVYFDADENKYMINNFTSILRIKDPNKVHPKFLFYQLFYKYNKGESVRFQNKTTGILNLRLDRYIEETYIHLPPLESQGRIARELDFISVSATLRRLQLSELNQLIVSLFYEMFGDPVLNDNGWEKKRISEICAINPRRTELGALADDTVVSFVPMNSVSESGEIDASQTREYHEVKTGYTYFRENDVLFAKITPCMENGKGAVARNLYNGIGFGSTEFHVLRPIKDMTDSEWLFRLTSLPVFRALAEKNMTGSAGQKRVPVAFFDQFKVGLPPLELQQKYANFVNQIESQKSLVKKSIDETQRLFDSLMSQYFDD